MSFPGQERRREKSVGPSPSIIKKLGKEEVSLSAIVSIEKKSA